MTSVDPVKFGKMQGDIEAIKSTLGDHTKILEKLDTKLDGVVTLPQFTEHIEKADRQLAEHDVRISKLEKAAEIEEASLAHKVLNKLSSKLVAIIVLLILGSLGVSLYTTLRNQHIMQVINDAYNIDQGGN